VHQVRNDTPLSKYQLHSILRNNFISIHDRHSLMKPATLWNRRHCHFTSVSSSNFVIYVTQMFQGNQKT
jgi:hypothetical protein